MSQTKKDDFDTQQTDAATQDMGRVSEQRFSEQIDLVIEFGEEMRLKRMNQYRTRGFWALNLSMLGFLIGGGAFGWFVLVHVDFMRAVNFVVISSVFSALLYYWASLPRKAYKKEYKSVFMPKLAKALNGLQYHPQRGVNPKILDKLLVIPQHNLYKAEDCFMGRYKGVKVIFSEARLYSTNTNRDEPVFQGIFALLETPNEVIEGHTILTANLKMEQAYASKRWNTLKKVHIAVSNPSWDRFQIYSTNPESAELMIGEKLLKELSEAADIFNESPLTAVMFGKKYVFLMIPHNKDMFEASDIYEPLTTKQHALDCRKEIEQLLEIIDVFDLYKPLKH